MQSEIELKPCPFCGGKAYVYPTEHGWSAQCEDCWSTGADKETREEAAAAWNHRAESENRVLTLEEVKAYCEGGVEAAPLWVEFSCLPSASRWMAARMPGMVCGESIKKYLNVFEYNALFRCWLRKPTPEETAETPWEV